MTPDQFVILAKCEAGLNNQMQSVHKFIKQGKHTKRMVDLKEYNKKVKKKNHPKADRYKFAGSTKL